MDVCTIMLQRLHLQEITTTGLWMGSAEGKNTPKSNISYSATGNKNASAQWI